MAVVGGLFAVLLSHESARLSAPSVPVWIATGSITLVGYLYVRSAFNHYLLNVPITSAEVVLGMGIGLYTIFHTRRKVLLEVLRRSNLARPGIDLFLLAILCLVIADRELPRQIMLSSDPDFHVSIARQIERLGAIAYHQAEWGSQGFNYPAGSGAVLHAWHLVGGLDVRELLVTLPVLFTFVGALLMVDSLKGMTSIGAIQRALVQYGALALSAGAFMLPLYTQYAHLEGAGRQLSILPVAMLIHLISKFRERGGRLERAELVATCTSLVVLAALNPANLGIAGALLISMVVYAGVIRQNALPVAALGALSLALALILEPYYHGLLGIAKQARVDTVIYDQSLEIKPFATVLSLAADHWRDGFLGVARNFSVLFAEEGAPMFLIFAVTLLFMLGVLRRTNSDSKPSGRQWAAIAAMILCFLALLYLLDGVATALMDDRRFFLLHPYLFFSATQYKTMFLTLCVSAVLLAASRYRLGTVGILLMIPVLVIPMTLSVRDHQEMYLDPRRDYCGAFGCLEQEDLQLIRRIESLQHRGYFSRQGFESAKILIPNRIMQAPLETWIVPEGAARVLPYYDVPPVAFYYYQGELEYSTASYLEHVCHRLDRQWLFARGIQYIFLPSQRESACVSTMESMIKSEETVLTQGNAHLLKLRPLAATGASNGASASDR